MVHSAQTVSLSLLVRSLDVSWRLFDQADTWHGLGNHDYGRLLQAAAANTADVSWVSNMNAATFSSEELLYFQTHIKAFSGPQHPSWLTL